MAELFNLQPVRTAPVEDAMITTAMELPNYRIVRNIGIVRGITVRSRSIVGNFFGGLQSLFGGNITIFTQLCERARRETYDAMRRHAGQQGANAIVAVHYDATELMPGLTESSAMAPPWSSNRDGADAYRGGPPLVRAQRGCLSAR